ncbi:MAG: hypothetical protein F6K32_21370, partial [Desertifilum sp. SIO1I2]|nr:hypothetical protein [Desertifilum sp. SIO1I2]
MFGEADCSTPENSPAYPIWKMEWFKLAIRLRGSVAPIIFPRVLFFAFLGVVVSGLYYWGYPVSLPFLSNVITNVVFNLVLGLLLVFRTNTAYDRYWEGRKLWGQIVVTTRNLSRQIWVNVRESEPEVDKSNKAATLNLLNAFALTTKLTLRKQEPNAEIEVLVSSKQYEELKAAKTPALKLITWISYYLQTQYGGIPERPRRAATSPSFITPPLASEGSS